MNFFVPASEYCVHRTLVVQTAAHCAQRTAGRQFLFFYSLKFSEYDLEANQENRGFF